MADWTLTCVECGSRQDPPPNHVVGTCVVCQADARRGILDVGYQARDLADWAQTLRREPVTDMWAYRPVLPVGPEDHVPPLSVGGTPLSSAPRLADRLDVSCLWLKDEGRNSTGSLKDRASALGVAKALFAGAAAISCASTGNAASSLAAFAASVGMPAYIFVPRTIPNAKLAQLRVFGATVFLVDGPYDEAYRLSEEASRTFGWYNRNAAVNPVLIEGKKTAGWEIAHQLGWTVPDWVALSMGDGCSLAGTYKAFREMRDLALIDRLPRFLGVQAEAFASIAQAYAEVQHDPPSRPMGTREVPRTTMADSIAVRFPRNLTKAVNALKGSSGAAVTVSDREIVAGMEVLGSHAGVFSEPAGATALAGVMRARNEGLIRSSDSVVVVASGNGLKDIPATLPIHGHVRTIAPCLQDLERALSEGDQ